MRSILLFIKSMNMELWVTILATIPVLELRGAIPVGAANGLAAIPCFLFAVLGNMLPVPAVILLGRKILLFFQKTRLLGRPCRKIEERTMKHRETIVRYSVAGLIILVAIPLPGTGAWTGALLAALLDIRMKYALPAVFAGVVIAGVIVTLLTYGIVSLGSLSSVF